MTAYRRHVKDLGPHGHPMSEAMSERADPNNYDGGYRYVTDGPFTDWAEKSRLDFIDAWRAAAGENPNMNGLTFPVRRVDNEPN